MEDRTLRPHHIQNIRSFRDSFSDPEHLGSLVSLVDISWRRGETFVLFWVPKSEFGDWSVQWKKCVELRRTNPTYL